jgi:hypothetical protein
MRIFQGTDTRQLDGHTRRPAEAEAWYYEPDDYAGDVLWSPPYPSRAAAEAAAAASLTEEEETVMPRVLLYEAGATQPHEERYPTRQAAQQRARQWVTRTDDGRGFYRRERSHRRGRGSAPVDRTRYWTAAGEREALVFDALHG